MNLICDDLDADLGYIISALLQNNGPLSINRTKSGINHFYIDEIHLDDPSMLPVILSELPTLIMAHYHAYPDTLSYYPVPLPHEVKKTKGEHAEEETARQKHATIAEHVFHGGTKAEVSDLTLTPEEQRIVMGMRCEGDALRIALSTLKNTEIPHFLNAEFHLNTRFIGYKHDIYHRCRYIVLFLNRQFIPLLHRFFQRLCVDRFTLTAHGLHFFIKLRFLFVEFAHPVIVFLP